jgi:hypothetical protein
MTNREPLQQPHAQKEKPDGLQTAGPLTDRTDHVRNGGDYTGNCAAEHAQEPVAWKVEVDIANHHGQSEYRTILAFRPDPRLANGTYIVNKVLSATPLYYATPKPNTKVNSEAIPEQISEPVAIVETLSMGEGKPAFHYIECRHLPEGTPLYTAPQRCPNCESLEAQNTELDRKLAELERREWVGLDRKEMLAIIDQQGAHKQTGLPMFYRDQCLDMARAIEVKLKEKNT